MGGVKCAVNLLNFKQKELEPEADRDMGGNWEQ